MTTVGLVGGLGPESTVDYYRSILAACERDGASAAPSIVIDSLDVRTALRLVEQDRAGFTVYLAASVERLAAAGADFVAMTANTAHLVFDEIAARSPVPLISIVDTCASTAKRLGFRRLALLGTRFTMEAPIYPDVCARYGIDVVVPDAEARARVHALYIGELLKGQFRDETREEFVALVGRLRDTCGIDGAILGGTELPLLLRSPDVAGVPLLDTTALHVDAIVQRLRGGAPAAVAGPTSSAPPNVVVPAACSAVPVAERLHAIVQRGVPALLALPCADPATPLAPGKWSPCEIVGHLVDSASNNHRRFLLARWKEDLVFEGYDQDAWVAAHEYSTTPWPELVDLWRAMNLHVARVMAATPEHIRRRAHTRHSLDRIALRAVPADQPATLEYLMDDYVAHVLHHLRQVLGAEWSPDIRV